MQYTWVGIQVYLIIYCLPNITAVWRPDASHYIHGPWKRSSIQINKVKANKQKVMNSISRFLPTKT